MGGGDRSFIFAAWKDQSVTASVTGWTSLGSNADGVVASGVGTGSMRLQAWYIDSDPGSDPTITFTGSPILAQVYAASFSFNVGETTWDTPTVAWAPIAAANPWSATTTTPVFGVPTTEESILIGFAALADDSIWTRATDALKAATGTVTWTGDHQEFVTNLSTTTGNDMSSDVGCRRITSGGAGAVTFTMTGTPSAAETGNAMFILQTVDGSAFTPSSGGAVPRGRDRQLHQLLSH
jgi:hypothetical protein